MYRYICISTELYYLSYQEIRSFHPFIAGAIMPKVNCSIWNTIYYMFFLSKRRETMCLKVRIYMTNRGTSN